MTRLDLHWNFRTTEQDEHFFRNSVKCLGMFAELASGHCYVPYPPNDNVFVIGDDLKQTFYNACPHKHSQLYESSCEVKDRIVCPIHRWSFDQRGNFLAGRGFIPSTDKNLVRSTTYKWQGFIMSGNNDWVDSINDKLKEDLKRFQGKNYKAWKRETIVTDYDWKIFYEIFLDLYHVRSCHPSLRSVVDVNNYQYAFGNGWSCQHAYLNEVRATTTKKTEDWLGACERLGLLDDSFKLLWLALYPNVMLESYPGCNIISQVYPFSPGRHANTVEFYFDESILKECPEFAQLTYDFWMETAVEDEEISRLMQVGRSNLSRDIEKVPEFNHPIEEMANAHWFNWMKEKELSHKLSTQ